VKKLAQYWQGLQRTHFPRFEEEIGETTPPLRRLIVALDVIEIERFVDDPALPRGRGRPTKARTPLARSFVAKAVLGLTTTRALRERLLVDPPLRRIVGFDGIRQIPAESTFSTTFAAFSAQRLPEIVHAALIKERFEGRLVFHVSRDSTDIPARARVTETPKPSSLPRKRGRPKKGEVRRPQRRLERQLTQTLDEMLDELPRAADFGGKRAYRWKGYKLHLDVADGGIPIAALLTSASLHDSQAAIPLEKMTAQRVRSLYTLMDSGYDAKEIRSSIAAHGKAAVIAPQRRLGQVNWLTPAQQLRFKERTTVERAYARLKDDFGARHVRVRGASKVMAHVMFGLLALTAEQLVRAFT
jgi:hypothetical protein